MVVNKDIEKRKIESDVKLIENKHCFTTQCLARANNQVAKITLKSARKKTVIRALDKDGFVFDNLKDLQNKHPHYDKTRLDYLYFGQDGEDRIIDYPLYLFFSEILKIERFYNSER